MKKYIFPLLILSLWLITACQKEDELSQSENICIIFINDQHAQIDHFAKLKHLVDEEKKQGKVILACSGDMFSGNPVVDIWEDKGYPMIDLMNKTGFDVTVIGNHEFDYGQTALKERMEQASFQWICANVDMTASDIPQPKEFVTLERGALKLTFLGLLETNGKQELNIPSTHPGKLENIVFDRPEEVIGRYANLKEKEEADILVALTHLGHNYTDGKLGDFQLAREFPYFDLIIGGHSSVLLDTAINDIPVFQAGKYLNYAGKINMIIKDKEIRNIHFELIDLSAYPAFDTDMQQVIDTYNESMGSVLSEIIGYSDRNHDKYQLGCFYTDALRSELGTDISFQNSGGIRNGLDEGEISVAEIYAIDPFNNGAMIYTMTASEIKAFLKGTNSWHAYSGIEIEQEGEEIFLKNQSGMLLDDNALLTVGINDYIPAVESSYFPENGEKQNISTAEVLIHYLENNNEAVDYPACSRFFKFQD